MTYSSAYGGWGVRGNSQAATVCACLSASGGFFGLSSATIRHASPPHL